MFLTGSRIHLGPIEVVEFSLVDNGQLQEDLKGEKHIRICGLTDEMLDGLVVSFRELDGGLYTEYCPRSCLHLKVLIS